MGGSVSIHITKFVKCTRSLCVIQMCVHACTHTLSLSHPLSLIRTYTHSLPLMQMQTLSLSNANPQSLSLSHSLIRSPQYRCFLTLIPSVNAVYTEPYICTEPHQNHNPPHTHTHTPHAHAHAQTHTHTHTITVNSNQPTLFAELCASERKCCWGQPDLAHRLAESQRRWSARTHQPGKAVCARSCPPPSAPPG